MAFIFAMSSRIGSVEHSRSFLTDLFGLSGYWLHVANGLLRKGAHLTEYAVLSLFFVTALRRAHGATPRVALVGGILGSLAYACTDEFHQSFVPGREGMVSDVVVDCAGATLGAGLMFRYRARGGTWDA